MKILIGYDGSECANNALEDLKNAGLPTRAEVKILTVTENWMLVLKEMETTGIADGENFNYVDEEMRKNLDEKAAEDFANAAELAQSARDRLKGDFPNWSMESEAVADFPERGFIKEAKKYQPDYFTN